MLISAQPLALWRFIGFLVRGMREIRYGAIDPVSRAQKFQSTQAALAALGTTRQGPPVSESCNKKVHLSGMAGLLRWTDVDVD